MTKKVKGQTVKLASAILVLTLILCGFIYDRFSADNVLPSDSEVTVLRMKNANVFEPVLPDNPVILPNDFSFQNEYQHGWWHFFANVSDRNGTKYGIQWSYFRVANQDRDRSGWQSPQLFISNIVISSGKKVWKEQRIARGGIGQAGMIAAPFKIWIDNWMWRSLGKTPFPGQLITKTDTFSLNIRSNTAGPFVLPGDRGYVAKHDLLPIASHNVTMPFLDVVGELSLDGQAPIRVFGSAWMSKEWGSGLLAEKQKGWDWFVLNLDDETTLSVNRYRHFKQMPHIFGTLSTNDGKVVQLQESDIQLEPLKLTTLPNNKTLPLQWRIVIPKYQIDLTTSAVNNQLWLPFIIPYWEGPIETKGSHNVTGFMQLTGY